MRSIHVPRSVGLAAVFLAALAMMAMSSGHLFPGPALAATISVNTFTDELNADGDCSLREAVVAANTNAAVDACTAGSGTDTINLQTGNYALMLAGSEDAAANGDLDLTGTVTIAGNNTTVKTIPATGDRVFHVLAGATATISGITVEGGQGGAGGGILNAGTLTLSGSTVWLNTGGNGAGVYNTGTLMVNSTTIVNNTGSLSGAGIYNSGTATLTDSTVSTNTATNGGGGIYSAGGSVTLTDSTVSDNDATAQGGGINVQAGTLTLNNSTVSGNDAPLGGGIYKSGTVGVPVPVTLNDSTVSGNGLTSTQGGGIYSAGGLVALNGSAVVTNTANGPGGGLYSASGGTLDIRGSTVSGNRATAGSGGGIFGANGSFTELRNSIASDNTAAGNGGGIFSGETLFLSGSTISGNIANADGGGVKVDINSTFYVVTSTISGNTASGAGGGAYLEDSNMSLTNSTVSGNRANADGGGLFSNNSSGNITSSTFTGNRAGSGYFGGGIYKDLGAAITLKSSIVANSPTGGNCFGDPLTSYGYNLSSDATCGLSSATDFPNTNPLLGTLAGNGGPTRTHALLAGSPALDAGLPTTDGGCSGGDDSDQRGVARPQAVRCDIGAYEANDSDGDGSPDPLDLDDDDDSVPDALDSCPLVTEDIDGYEDGDGCPDTDNDLDGICDAGLTSPSCTGSDTGRYLWKNPLGATVDCRNVAEDIDNFHDNDGCPEPDNDYDTISDADDGCDGSDTNVGADGIADTGDEPVLYLTPYQAREDFDGVIDWDGCHDSPNDDYDGDAIGDETEVFNLGTDPVNPDTDGDGVTDSPDNCPAFANSGQNMPTWAVPANDADCDGFNKTREEWVGTLPAKRCPNTPTAGDEAVDSWPTDFNDSRVTNLSDVVLMGPVYNQSTGTDPAKRRLDLNASGGVNLSDVVLMGPFYNKGCG